MRNKLFLHVTLLCTLSINVLGQSKFQIGSASVSIEPDSSTFSLALAGYGAPRDGRFTISWKFVGEASEIQLITGVNGKLYAINNDELLVGDTGGKNIHWRKVGTAHKLLALTGLDGKLYAINNKSELLLGEISRSGVNWKNIGIANNIISLTGLDGKLYAANNINELLVREAGGDNSKWKKIGHAEKVLSMTSDREKIYAVNAENTIWSRRPDHLDIPWLKIGRFNNITYGIKVKQVAVLNGRLYALADEGKLYTAEHSTRGDLSASALAIKSGKEIVVIVGVDLCGFDYSLANDIKNLIEQKRNIPPAAIFINGSHTHFAPVTQNFSAFGKHGQLPDSSYLNNTVKKGIIKAIELALENMSPSDLYFGRGTTSIGHNRSSENGQTPYDNAVDVLKAVTTDKKNSNVLFLTGCHPVFRNAGREGFTINANFPGITRRLIEEKFNVDKAIFVQGCAGDINPRDDDHEKTGMKLALDVLGVLNGNMEEISGNISYALDTIQIPVKPWSVDEIQEFKKNNSDAEKGDVGAEKNVRWANMMLRYYHEGTMPKAMPVYVQTLNIGNWKLIGLSREVVTEYGLAIKDIWPEQLISVAGYTNDVASYLPKDRHIKAGVYEGYDSFFWYAQPAIFPVNVFDIVVDKIKTLNR